MLDRRIIPPCEPRRQSPWCALRGVLPGQRRREWTARPGTPGQPVQRTDLDAMMCGSYLPSQPGRPSWDRALIGREPRSGRPGRSRTAPRAPTRGTPVGSAGPSARNRCHPRRPPPGPWPPRRSAGGGTDRHLPSTTGRTRIGSRPAGRAAGATAPPSATSPPAVHPVNFFMGRRTWHSPSPAAHPGLVSYLQTPHLGVNHVTNSSIC